MTANELLELQRDLAMALVPVRDLGTALEKTVATVTRIEGVDCALVYLMDPVTHALEMARHLGISDDYARYVGRLEADSPRAKLVADGSPVYGDQNHPLIKNDPVREREGLRAFGAIPVKHNGSVVACLVVSSRGRDRFPLSVRHTLEAVAATLGSAIFRTKSEQDLTESRANLQLLLDTAQDLIFVMDRQGRGLHWNRACVERSGYSNEELGEKIVDDMLPSEWRSRAPSLREKAFAGEQSVFRTPLLTKDGREIPFETRVARGVWAGQEALFCIARDVSQQEVAEQALRESEERFRRFAEVALEGISIVRDGLIEDANPALLAMFRCQYSEMVGHHILEFVAPDSQEFIREKLQAERPGRFELNGLRKDGTIVPVECIVRRLPGAEEKLEVAALRDLTEQKRMEQSLKTLLARLLNAQEEERRRLAMELHEGPAQRLTGLLITLEGAITRCETDHAGAHEVLSALPESLRKVIRQMRETIQDLRPVPWEATSLVRVVEELAHRLEESAQLPIEVAVQGSEVRLTREAMLILFRIVQEGLTNVTRHAKANRATISLNFACDSLLKLSISDDGAGFAFDEAREKGKLHFGLLMMREEAEILGGEMQIQSARGKGTTLSFTFPLHKLCPETEDDV